MFLDESFNSGAEPPKKNRSHKGYPEVRDPAADAPRGVMNEKMDAGALRKMRQHYGVTPKF